MNPNEERHSKRFLSAWEWSRRRLETPRKNRYEWIQQYVGAHYSDGGSKKKVPMNLLELAITIYTRQIAGGTPRVMAESDYPEMRPAAYNLELALNHLIAEINLRETIQRSVKGAMFGWTAVKQGLASLALGEVDGFTHNIGQPYADEVTLDDWCHDMRAKRFDKVSFCGDRYRLPLEHAREMPHWDKQRREALGASLPKTSNQSGDDREETISVGDEMQDDEYRPFVELIDVWFPLEGILVTYPSGLDDNQFMPLSVIDWVGGEQGPYHILSFSEVPGQILPLPPAATFIDLHMLANQLFRKLANQAERQKTVLGYQGGAQKDAERITEIPDGKGFRVDNPQQMREMKFGGLDPPTLAFALQIRDLASYMWGNLDALGGLGPQSDTLGQDQMLTAAASQRLTDMRERANKFTDSIIEGLGDDLFSDPLIELPLVKRVSENFEVGVPVEFTPERREGDKRQYNIRLDPYSMTEMTPGLQLDTLRRTLSEVIFPLLPSMEAQGVTVNVVELIKQIGRLSNQPQLNRILSFEGGPAPESVGGEGPVDPKQSPVTTRRYERINRPGATRQGKDQVLSSALLGVKSQGSEQAAALRPSGT